MKWRLRFLWMKARPFATFLMLVGVPFLPVIPWLMAAGPDPAPIPASELESAGVAIISSAPKGPTSPGAAVDGLPLELVRFRPSEGSPPPPKPAPVDEGPSRGPSPPLDAAGIRKAARGWEMRDIDADGWKLLMSARFAVRGNGRTDDLRTAAAFAERFLDAIHERLKGDVTDLRFSIRVFAQEEEFRQWASCKGSEASRWFYDPHDAELALLFGPEKNLSELSGDLMRGVALEYLDRVLGRVDPPWVLEGVSEWLGDYEIEKGLIVPRARDRDARREDRLLTLDEMARLESAAFRGEEGPARIAEAASFVRFLDTRHPRAVGEWVRSGSLDPFGGADRLEREWRERRLTCK
ncbi:MAG TPA: hypothetical protein VK661_07465 [Planctomycetota bacterium]|nr:hypothetical protein [Planctomycetota bacterium]